MPPTGDAAADTDADSGRETDQKVHTVPAQFRFIPKDLAAKCRQMIESYHAINGYRSLPDMLWHSDGRDVIERDSELMQIFASASKSRSAKRANDSFRLLATAIISVEVLARDLAGWGQRYPAAKHEADRLLVDLPPRQRNWLIDMYLYPSLGSHREFTDGPATSVVGSPPSARN